MAWMQIFSITFLESHPCLKNGETLVLYKQNDGTLPMDYDRSQMDTFAALLALCAWNSPVTGEFPSQRQVRRSLNV